MRHSTWVALAALLACACASGPWINQEAMHRIKQAALSLEWDETSAVTADFTCDGKPDTAMVGYGEGSVMLGVLAAGADQAKVFSFSVGDSAKGSFCQQPVTLTTRPMSCIFSDGQALPDCVEFKGCSAITLSDGACSPVNFFWNSARKSLAWWRS